MTVEFKNSLFVTLIKKCPPSSGKFEGVEILIARYVWFCLIYSLKYNEYISTVIKDQKASPKTTLSFLFGQIKRNQNGQ